MIALAMERRTPSGRDGTLGLKESTTPSTTTMIAMAPGPQPTATSTTSLSSHYQHCRILIERLRTVKGMDVHLENSSHIPNHHERIIELCRNGVPLFTLYNALEPEHPLVPQPSWKNPPVTINDRKRYVYVFLKSCSKVLGFADDEVCSITDIFDKNNVGHIKVLNTIDRFLDLLTKKGLCIEPQDCRLDANLPSNTRDRVVLELLETERSYVEDLKRLQNYEDELKAQGVLSRDTIHELFGNFKDLVAFNISFLIELEITVEKPPEEQRLGLLFKKAEKDFAVYEPYCANYNAAQKIVMQEKGKLQKVADILTPSYELTSLLIKPVQRICKYALMLQQLIKVTDKSWPYYAEMEEGLEAIKRVTEKANETQREHENLDAVKELKRRLSEDEASMIDQHGKLLIEGKLTMLRNDNERELIVYLFERMLLSFKESKDTRSRLAKSSTLSLKKNRRNSLSRNVLQRKSVIPTSNILSVINRSTDCKWFLEIKYRGKKEDESFQFKFINDEQVKLWETLMNRAIQQNASSNRPTPSTKSIYGYESDSGDEEDSDGIPSFRSRNMSMGDSMMLLPASPPPSSPASPISLANLQSPNTLNGGAYGRPYRSLASIEPLDNSMPNGAGFNTMMRPMASRTHSHSTAFGTTAPPASYTMDPTQSLSYRNRSQSIPNLADNHHHEPAVPPLPRDSAPHIPTMKIKLNSDHGIYAIVAPSNISFSALMERVERKLRSAAKLSSVDLGLKYVDEDGDMITISSNDDVQMAFENRGENNTVTLYVTI